MPIMDFAIAIITLGFCRINGICVGGGGGGEVIFLAIFLLSGAT